MIGSLSVGSGRVAAEAFERTHDVQATGGHRTPIRPRRRPDRPGSRTTRHVPIWPGDRRQPESDPRRVLRQPRHRHRQVRRLPDHQLGRPARRGRPLARRHRQPGAAAARRQAGPARPADDEHPFGYGRERYFWAFVVALVLFSMGGLFALYEGIEKVRHPHEVENLGVAIGILVFAIVLETFSLRTAYREASHAQGRRPVVVALHPQRRSSPSCRSCCSRTSAPRSACSSPCSACCLAHFTDEPTLGRRRLDRHRRAARRHRHRPRRRDEGPADRRGRRRTTTSTAIRSALERRAERAPAHPPADPAPRPRRAARRGQARVRPRADGRAASPTRSTTPSGRCATPCRSPALIYIEPDVFRPTPRRDRAPGSSTGGSSACVAVVGGRAGLLQQLDDRQVGRRRRARSIAFWRMVGRRRPAGGW